MIEKYIGFVSQSIIEENYQIGVFYLKKNVWSSRARVIHVDVLYP
jgi:hypothetical protein